MSSWENRMLPRLQVRVVAGGTWVGCGRLGHTRRVLCPWSRDRAASALDAGLVGLQKLVVGLP